MEDIINTLLDQERVTSTYADIYFNDDYCRTQVLKEGDKKLILHEPELFKDITREWISPSDLLIGKVELIPPFTSKTTRGKTHGGILAIGNEILLKEHKCFLQSLTGMLNENDESWNHILINEKKLITKKVREIFKNIFEQKSIIMRGEVMKFYEDTLRELESHIQSEVQKVLTSVHAKMISTLNIEISSKLKKERMALEKVLKNKCKTEIAEIVTYYRLLLNNELRKNSKLIDCALNDRNEALQAFCRQIDAERLTTSMYLMSLERKKCKIKKICLENFQNKELSEKLTRIKEKQDIIESYKHREYKVSDINKEWENKMEKILELFLKFISFSLKLLPEQSTFLIDFQKMVVLQLNELKKQPNFVSNILIDQDSLQNIIEFETSASDKQPCDLKPFVLVGDLSDPIPPRYESIETLPSDVDLPLIRVNRHYLYAKCHGYEEIKESLQSQQCQCVKQQSPTYSEIINPKIEAQLAQSSSSNETSSSAELIFIDDIKILKECPARTCKCWTGENLFPFDPSYIDFSKKKFERVKAILGEIPPKSKPIELLSAKNIACSELPFSETKEKYRHVETQYSIEVLDIVNVDCTCIYNNNNVDGIKSTKDFKEIRSKSYSDVLVKRKASLRLSLEQNPNLLKIFTDENFDFQL